MEPNFSLKMQYFWANLRYLEHEYFKSKFSKKFFGPNRLLIQFYKMFVILGKKVFKSWNRTKISRFHFLTKIAELF